MNGYYQQSYQPSPQGNPGMSYEDRYLRSFAEKHNLKKLSAIAGLSVIGFISLQFLSGILLGASGYYDKYLESEIFASIFNIASYIISAFFPFFIAYRTMTPSEQDSTMKFEAPVSKSMIPVTVIIGLMACTIGNFVTGYLQSFIESAGYEITAGEVTVSTSVEGLLIDIIYIAALPALIEEFALRGVVMQPLRRYGDAFAIVMSSIVFALMHGNLMQIPFAFIVGTVIGYLVITTGSIWTGVIIHFFNNLYSVVITYLLEVRPTAAQEFYTIYNIAAILFGVCCIAIYFTSAKRYKLSGSSTVMTKSSKTSSYVFSVPMLIAILILCAETAYFIERIG